MPPVQEMVMRPKDEIATTEAVSILSIIERAAKDPSVDVEKMERLMQMHERVLARQSEDAFNQAMSAAQKDMKPVAADANNPQTKSKYASYAALDRALRPIYTEHGFGLSFDTGDAPAGFVRVLCYVTHDGGGSRKYKIDMPADGKGAKGGDVMTLTHAVGAGASYGMRYLLKMIFNVAVGEDDRDGNAPVQASTAPAGYDNWISDLSIVAKEQGKAALSEAWKASKQEFKDYAAKHNRERMGQIKKSAEGGQA